MGIFGKIKLFAVNEVYFGKTKDVQELQSYLSAFRSEVIRNKDYFYQTGNNSNNLKKFNAKCEEMFGFKCFDLLIVFSPDINAYTMSIGLNLDVVAPNNHLKSLPDGVKFDKKRGLGYCCQCRVFSGLFCDDRFTDGEILAIILHEIGHNFEEALNGNSTIAMFLLKPLLYVDWILSAIASMNILAIIQTCGGVLTSFNFVKLFLTEFKRVLQQNKLFNDFTALSDSVSGVFNSIMSLAGKISMIMLLTNPVAYLMTLGKTVIAQFNPIHLLRTTAFYNNEKMADSFATMYGYGDELSSGLMKMSYTQRKDRGIIDNLSSIAMFPFLFVILPLDEHPDTVVRVRTQLGYLKKELEGGTNNPKMKQEISNQIDTIQERLDLLLQKKQVICDNADMNVFRMAYSMSIENSILGKDFREILANHKDNFEEIERRYKEKL